jgi:HAD superfamily phosphatase
MKAIVIFDIDGVIRDVAGSYRQAIVDTVEQFTNKKFRPTMAEIDDLKSEGIWNNDWKASQELIYRYLESQGQSRNEVNLDYAKIVDFFQGRYRGENQEDPRQWDGYITQEPLLVTGDYFQELTSNEIGWGFFSGATRGSAEYILKQRLGLDNPILIAMNDAPGKPDPTGLFMSVKLLEEEKPDAKTNQLIPIFYVGDTVADIHTIVKAQKIAPQRIWKAIAVLPPHVQQDETTQLNYRKKLIQAGALMVLKNVQELTSSLILT